MEQQTNSAHGLWRQRKYFALRKPIGRGNNLFVSAGLLTDGLLVNAKTVRNGISKFNLGKSCSWKSYSDGKAIMIDYESISEATKLKAGLPIDSNDALDFFRGKEKEAEDVNTDAEVAQLHGVLDDVYHNRWPASLKFYQEKITDYNERILYAKAHALIDSMISAHKEKWPARVIFGVYQRIMRCELDAFHEPKFHTESAVYFWRVIRNCQRQGIAETLVHDSLGVSREYRVKMTGQIKAYIRILFRSPQRFTVATIIQMVRKKYEVELSPSTIKRQKSTTEDRNVLEYDSNGKIHSRQNGLPGVTRFLAEAPGDQYQGDFYDLQFICRNHKGDVVRLCAYVVLDTFSKKVVGWGIEENKSVDAALNAFKMAFVNECFLPEEILIDNDSYYRKPDFKRLMQRLNNLGVIITKAFPRIATWKAEIESFFGVFQKMHSAKPWYIGEDVQSKNTAGNPSKEFVSKLYAKVSSMLSVTEMTTEFGKMIEEYNYATNDRKKKIAPTDTFRMYESQRTLKWEVWMEPLMFWNAMPKKRIKEDGRIDLQIDGVEYCYQVTKAETLWKYKNSDVRMCYNPEDTSKVHVFERGTLKYIGEIELRMVMTRENKKEVMKKQRRILFEAQQYLKDRRREDEELVSGIIGKSPRKESLPDKIIKRQLKRRKLEREVQEVKIHD